MSKSLPAVKRAFVDGEFGQIHYRIAGQISSLPAIVCLHMVSKSSRLFDNVMPLLAQSRLVIAIDFPGYGESSPPPDESLATIDNYALAVWQVLDSLQINYVDFIGYHTGAMVSVCASHYHPHKVSKVINISAPVFTEQEVINFCTAYSPILLDEAGSRFRIMWERIIENRGPGMTLQMCARSLAENLRGGDVYEWGHMAAFHYAKEYIEQVQILESPLIIMNLNDDLHEHSKRIDTYIRLGFRKDYVCWGTGFLDAFTQEVSDEMLMLLNTDIKSL